jgi:hypothetical protein
MIRDQALAVSGRLVRTVGGRPVKPYQPDGLWSEATFGKKKYVQDSGDSLYRRSIYTFWRRISAPPMFFDNASRYVCSVNPSLTNTPMHALATLNDPTYIEAARLLAIRSSESKGPPALRASAASAQEGARAKLIKAFEIVHCRPPTEDESTILQESYDLARKAFSEDPKALVKFLAVGDSAAPSDIDAIDLGALTSVCLSLLNTDEALSKE